MQHHKYNTGILTTKFWQRTFSQTCVKWNFWGVTSFKGLTKNTSSCASRFLKVSCKSANGHHRQFEKKTILLPCFETVPSDILLRLNTPTLGVPWGFMMRLFNRAPTVGS